MKEIAYEKIVEEVKTMCMESNYNLGEDVYSAFKQALQTERSETGKEVLTQLIDNADIAKAERVPMCQDTGTAVFMVEVGQDCHIAGGRLVDAINEGVEKGYGEGYLRNSMVYNPMNRKNTGNNTPAIVHIDLVEGEELTLHMTAKGGGAENMSALKMLKPSDGMEGVKEYILSIVKEAGPNACPPLVVGIGIGGNFERCAFLAKKSLFRPLGVRHEDPAVAELEMELMEQINRLGIGPQGMGGSTTALDVKVELESCHIAALPVAVNLNCHASRHQTIVMK
ncbi:fumarate hydratase subunit alpha [Planomicrobium stackebrandtii]|uniref:Fumarate hydratase subunit alpha n=1 Tax=Planomicrobium stackebrandtii TaxID=253160 RepID=A0ABU0GU42_9BACL|nr:fumarate hydratase [Planomicrobium stackebrandtii]MDQ0428077.1 fumarate hydratase subunit alpha [Planomicrobium stackebrandtii]